MRVGLAILCLGPGATGLAVAQGDTPEPLPPYDVCMARAVDHFELELTRNRAQGADPDFAIVTRDRVQHCGALAIVTCDRDPEPLACQAALAADQGVLRAAILEHLPEPGAVAGDGSVWSDGLYPTLWAVARGSSAGPDCAGADPVYEAWCVTHQANLKVSEAVMLWQVARLLDVVEPAVSAGWIGAPPPARPDPRPEAAE